MNSLVGAAAADATHDTKVKAAIFLYFITLYFRVALYLKRLHDFGWSGWWTLPAALVALFSALTNPWFESSLSSERGAACFMAGILWTIVILAGSPAGAKGTNRYGPLNH